MDNTSEIGTQKDNITFQDPKRSSKRVEGRKEESDLSKIVNHLKEKIVSFELREVKLNQEKDFWKTLSENQKTEILSLKEDIKIAETKSLKYQADIKELELAVKELTLNISLEHSENLKLKSDLEENLKINYKNDFVMQMMKEKEKNTLRTIEELQRINSEYNIKLNYFKERYKQKEEVLQSKILRLENVEATVYEYSKDTKEKVSNLEGNYNKLLLAMREVENENKYLIERIGTMAKQYELRERELCELIVKRSRLEK